MGTQLHLPKRGQSLPPIYGSCLLWPNGWMAQDCTWHGGEPWSRPHCARWGPSPFPQKGAEAPNFRPISIVANGWMHQDASWYEGRPRPRRLCVRWGPSSPSPIRSAHVYYGQTAGWINMVLGMEVGLGPGHIALDGDPAPPKKGHNPQFSANVYCCQTAVCIRILLGTEVGLSLGNIVLDMDPAPALL